MAKVRSRKMTRKELASIASNSVKGADGYLLHPNAVEGKANTMDFVVYELPAGYGYLDFDKHVDVLHTDDFSKASNHCLNSDCYSYIYSKSKNKVILRNGS
jgi:hypothetical protein